VGRSTNWAGNVTFNAQRLFRPTSVEQLQHLVAGSPRIRAVGTGHSFNRIADTSEDLVSLEGLASGIELAGRGNAVTVGAGTRYAELAQWLYAEGLALPNLGSLPHISVGGACATGTHGSGNGNGNLATVVSAVEMVTADGEVVVLDRDTDAAVFGGAVVGLGSLGIVTRLTLDTTRSFDVAQYVYDDMPEEQLTTDLSTILSSAYSVSVFTDWRPPRIRQVWLKRRIDSGEPWPPEPQWLGATLADGPRHPVAGMSAAVCTEQQGVVGPWHERLPHFRRAFPPRGGSELQSEYHVSRTDAAEALAALRDIRDDIARILHISEIRSCAADDLWMSPNYRRDTVSIHFTWVNDADAVSRVLRLIEPRLQPYAARPHWGKLFCMAPEVVRAQYERSSDFEKLLADYDPAGKFRNEFIDAHFPRL